MMGDGVWFEGIMIYEGSDDLIIIIIYILYNL